MNDLVSTYKLLDSGLFQKLEQVGPYRLVRPAAQAVWRPKLDELEWGRADAVFSRFAGGEGTWVKNRKMPESWTIDLEALGRLVIRLTDFGHLGIFPEQHDNWRKLEALVRDRAAKIDGPLQVLNLFAYTGGSTLAAARGGAHVVHLDASKTSVAWGRENAEAAGLGEHPIRWIVDDVQKFVAREVRREARYHGIILDPPSYGRGPKGQIWKIEDHLPLLLQDLQKILADDHVFILLSAHSPGYTPVALKNLILDVVPAGIGSFTASEMLVLDEASGRGLPSGASCFYVRD